MKPVGVDFLAVRRDASQGEAAAQVFWWGAACKTASMPDACKEELLSLSTSAPLAFESGHGYDVVFTRGDEVGRAPSIDSLLDLLGTIDTPTEAFLMAFASGQHIPCGLENYRPEGTSFVFLTRSIDGCGGIEEHEAMVDRGGTVTEGESVTLSDEDPCPDFNESPSAESATFGRIR